MKEVWWIPVYGVAAFALGMGIGGVQQERKTRPCESRYELRDSGIAGLVVRLDKVTGETVSVPALPSAQATPR